MTSPNFVSTVTGKAPVADPDAGGAEAPGSDEAVHPVRASVATVSATRAEPVVVNLMVRGLSGVRVRADEPVWIASGKGSLT